MLADLYRLYKTFGKSGVFYPDALWATAQFLGSYVEHGSSLTTLAKWAARRFPNQVAVVDEDRSITFRELIAEAEGMAGWLEQTHHVHPRQRVGLLGRNSIDFVKTLLACEMLGVNILLLHTNFVTETLERLQEKHTIDLLVCDKEFEQALKPVRALPKTIYFSIPAIFSTTKPIRLRKKSNIILLTSGTTGQPKVIRRRPKLSVKTLAGLLEALQLTANSRTLLTLPLSHGHGLATLAFSLLFGATLYIFRKSRTEDFVRCIRENFVDTVVLVPTILYRLLQEQEELRVHKIISGSAPLDEKLATRALQTFGDILYNLYGSSEAGLISLATPEALRQQPATLGKVLPGVNLKIENSHIHVIKDGQPFDTGDMGYFDEHNNLYLLGRSDDMLICGGENVYPHLIEEKVNGLEYIQECAVVGVPDAEYGQTLHLYVVLNRQVSKDDIARDLEGLFPRALRAQKIFMLRSLPQTSSGKLARHKLTEIQD
jgi:acyl-CoA synthetase (AMP-forming)/AMP-acid ligase II